MDPMLHHVVQEVAAGELLESCPAVLMAWDHGGAHGESTWILRDHWMMFRHSDVPQKILKVHGRIQEIEFHSSHQSASRNIIGESFLPSSLKQLWSIDDVCLLCLFVIKGLLSDFERVLFLSPLPRDTHLAQKFAWTAGHGLLTCNDMIAAILPSGWRCSGSNVTQLV